MCAAVEAAEAEVHAALCNNISTKDVLDALSRLISHTQKYKELGFRAPAGARRPRCLRPLCQALLRKAFTRKAAALKALTLKPYSQAGAGGWAA